MEACLTRRNTPVPHNC